MNTLKKSPGSICPLRLLTTLSFLVLSVALAVSPNAVQAQSNPTLGVHPSWAGDEPGEEQTVDIVPGTWADSGEWDEDGDNTVSGYSVPNPGFQVQLGTNHMGGWQWTPNGEVILYINGTEAATVQTDEWGNFSIHFGELDPFVSGMD
ncbi:MAG: hypothetical protein AAB217_02365, partial [Chloroflexota bacterium]